jgi:hypothetical protein
VNGGEPNGYRHRRLVMNGRKAFAPVKEVQLGSCTRGDCKRPHGKKAHGGGGAGESEEDGEAEAGADEAPSLTATLGSAQHHVSA